MAPTPADRADGPADILERNARTFPAKAAIVHPDGHEADGSIRYSELTYGELHDQVERLAAGFHRIGITRGTRTILMTSPGPDLFAVVFALIRIGAVPVVVDPGMGVKRMLHCYRAVGAEAFIGLPVAHVVRVLGRGAFRDVRAKVTVGRRWFWGGETLARLRVGPRGEALPRPAADDLQMIAFTTGSTGPAKGVEYTHRMSAPMLRLLQAVHERDSDDVSLITLPAYGILDLLHGSTLVLAPVSPAKVADARPELLTDALTRFRVTSMIASPALLRVLGQHLKEHRTELPDLRFVAAGGAPVPPDVVATVRGALGEKAEFHVTYGATEALPISSVESADVLGSAEALGSADAGDAADVRDSAGVGGGTAALSATGAGTCVGRPLPGMAVRIIRVSDGPVARWGSELALPQGEIGEIVLAGDAVSPGYHGDPAANAQYKIPEETADGTTRLWHRTGDLGYLDTSGRLWFCGRRAQRVRTPGGDLHTVRCEGVFNAHPEVRRAALVGVGEPGAKKPVVCVEIEPGVTDARWRELVAELRTLAAEHEVTRGLEEFLRHPAFPVDIRHNAKIGREQLGVWATRQLAARRRPATTARTWALRAVPLAGWAYLLARPVLPDHPVVRALWWADAFLSVGVHAAQIPAALQRGRAAGYRDAATAGLTMLYGATWWRTLPPAGPARDMEPARDEKPGMS
ncbi:fatty acid CoA ligase family protein [Streptomyces sp. NPDC096310]|uniref:fatty acid CoA ligase family protein n=1 Tax=Streptomyces sp. NPDC096310 TaxID=3366082 RepID=UPI0037FCDEBA